MASESLDTSGIMEMWTQLRPLVGGGVGSVLLFIVVVVVQWLRADAGNIISVLVTGKRQDKADRRSDIEKMRDALDQRNARIVTDSDTKLRERDARIDRLEREMNKIIRDYYHATSNIQMERSTVDNMLARAGLPSIPWKPLPNIEELPPD